MTSRKRSSGTQELGNDSASHSKKAKVSQDNVQVDNNGDQYWEISKMRRVTLSEFRNKTLVNVREYYEKDGQELPGRKGISMSVEQFAALIKILPDIEQALGQKGVSIPRPSYSEAGSPSHNGDGRHRNSDEAASPSKQNIEATSDEDEGDE